MKPARPRLGIADSNFLDNAAKMIGQNLRVSVVIPTYNYGKYLADCVNSVFRQSEKNIEIVIVDDGSTDNTTDVVKSFHGRVKYVYQDNRGLSAARNVGLRRASGDLIQLLDSDDLLGVDAIEAKANFLRRNPDVSVAVSPNILFSAVETDGKPIADGCWPLYRKNLDVHLACFNVAPVHAFLVRRDVIERAGDFDESLKACEDYDYWLRVAALGYIPHYCGEGTAVYYRRHATSMSSNLARQYRHDALLHPVVLRSLLASNRVRISQSHWLAFYAGLLTTLMRVELRGDPVLDDLGKLFFKALQDAGPVLPPVFDRLDLPGFYYFLLVRRRLRQITRMEDAGICELGAARDRFRLRGGLELSAPRDIFRLAGEWWHDPLLAQNFTRAVARTFF